LDRQRIDKWLWHARVVRTRSAAAALVSAGYVRLNGDRTDAPARAVRPGDVLTVALDRTVRILKVAGFAERRGPSEVAVGLYEDLTPPPVPVAERAPDPAAREPGSGRPTKLARRQTDRFTGGHDGGGSEN
jgi:ribosome-associated heat shock protein Hsp15